MGGENTFLLESPFFYNHSIGIRFEIGPQDIEIWKDSARTQVKEEYLEEALSRTIRIFDSVFDADDNISVVYQIFSDGRRRIKATNLILRCIDSTPERKDTYTDVYDIYPGSLSFKSHCWKRLTISGIQAKNIRRDKILLATLHKDFGALRPKLDGDCFFINNDKQIALYLYDDRGMDVVATSREALLPLYESCNDLILDFDRDHIDSVFQSITAKS